MIDEENITTKTHNSKKEKKIYSNDGHNEQMQSKKKIKKKQC